MKLINPLHSIFSLYAIYENKVLTFNYVKY
jgi:hypothetical protein